MRSSLLLCAISAVSAQEDKAAANKSEILEAITNIETGLGIGKIPDAEKAAYDACIKAKVDAGTALPDKNLDSANHLAYLSSCYNVKGL